MSEIEHWRRRLREAEAELEAARTRTQVNSAAKKLQRAKAEFKEIESDQAAAPRRRSKGRARSVIASS